MSTTIGIETTTLLWGLAFSLGALGLVLEWLIIRTQKGDVPGMAYAARFRKEAKEWDEHFRDVNRDAGSLVKKVVEILAYLVTMAADIEAWFERIWAELKDQRKTNDERHAELTAGIAAIRENQLPHMEMSERNLIISQEVNEKMPKGRNSR